MKMKRLLVNLSLLAIAHMIMMASGSVVAEEMFNESKNMIRLWISLVLSIITLITVVVLYTSLYLKTPKDE